MMPWSRVMLTHIENKIFYFNVYAVQNCEAYLQPFWGQNKNSKFIP